MAKAASYFYNANDTSQQTLHKRITPNDSQYEEQQSRWNDLAEHLVDDLKEQSGFTIRTWLQGSYKFATQIRPVTKTEEFDIDLGIYFCWAGTPNSGRFGAKQLKQMVQDSLDRFKAKNEDASEVVTPPKLRCCRLRFRNNFHIDVPAYHLDEERDARSLATQDNTWESSDPKAIYKWFIKQFPEEQRGQIRRIVRYTKAWAALHFAYEARPSSLLLSVLVVEASKEHDWLPTDDDEALAIVLKTILKRVEINQNVANPVDENENLATRLTSNSWYAFLEKFRSFSHLAGLANEDSHAVIACSRWAEVFEHLFPLPDVSGLNEQTSNLPSVLVLPEIAVNAVSKANSNFRYSGSNSIGPIPKNCTITFEVTNPFQMPNGTEFYWMVRNEGDEADNINDLGHKAGRGLTAEEQSAYKGTHLMDCTAVNGGRIIGLRRVPVKIIGVPLPTNRPRRSTIIKLLGKR